MLEELIRRGGKGAHVRRESISGTWGDKKHKNVTYVTLDIGGRHVSRHMDGNGPIDATFKAIFAACDIAVVLENYEVQTEKGVGTGGQGRITVWLRYNGHTYRGIAQSHNTNVCAADACLAAINKMIRDRRRKLKTRRSSPRRARRSVVQEVQVAAG